MASRRRFEAGFETILRDLRATFARMGPERVTIELGGSLSKDGQRQIARQGWALATQQPALFPSGAAVSFVRDGEPYRYPCTQWTHPLDNLRAAQRAVSTLYSVFDEYGVGRGERSPEEFRRLFGGFLALGDGDDPPWWETLGVAPGATPAQIKAAYLDLVRRHHPDKPGGDEATFKRVQRAYEAALALGQG